MQATLEDLLKAGVHFGHVTRRWNPKMEKYIFMQRNDIHIIDLKLTLSGLQRAFDAVKEITAAGEQILFAGTKPQAKEIIQAEAIRCGMPYIAEQGFGQFAFGITEIEIAVLFGYDNRLLAVR